MALKRFPVVPSGEVFAEASPNLKLYEWLSKIWDIHEKEENAGNWTPGQKRNLNLTQFFTFDFYQQYYGRNSTLSSGKKSCDSNSTGPGHPRPTLDMCVRTVELFGWAKGARRLDPMAGWKRKLGFPVCHSSVNANILVPLVVAKISWISSG